MLTTATIRKPRLISGLTGVCMMLASWHAWSWGHTGHVEISRIAIDKLPEEIPFFVRNDLVLAAIGELGPEADESKTTGIVAGVSSTGSLLTARTAHDAERDPGHFIDIDDTGVIIGGVVPLAGLPVTREAFDTAQRTGSPAQTQYSGGYVPYTILDGFQQLRKDFGMWRAFKAGLYSAVKESDREYFRFHL